MDERTVAGWRAYAEMALTSAEAQLDGTERSRQRYVAALRGVALVERYARLVQASVTPPKVQETADALDEPSPPAGSRVAGKGRRG